jgi:hypothetical protein
MEYPYLKLYGYKRDRRLSHLQVLPSKAPEPTAPTTDSAADATADITTGPTTNLVISPSTTPTPAQELDVHRDTR